MALKRFSGSFRDPAGRVFLQNGVAFRRIHPAGRESYERLMHSGLYDSLARDGLLVRHEDLGPLPDQPGAITIIRPEQVAMLSYPYEWCFSQFRDAALLTLRVQRRALEFGMSLKDASAYNVQFVAGRPILIDTLSLEPYTPGPWLAYRQFCQHFYAPLLLAARVDPRMVRMQQLFVDGMPIGLASGLLPRSSWLRAGPLLHVHLHALGERRWAASNDAVRSLDRPASSPRATLALVDSLERAIEGVRWSPRGNWTSYYEDQASYSPESFAHKVNVVTGWFERIKPSRVWDLGANTGYFSKLSARQGALTVALDADPACVEALCQEARRGNIAGLLPLVFDLTSPSPAIGWANEERMSLEERGPADVVVALALVHHVSIGNNVPLTAFADYLARLGRHVIVEFVPKSDPMAKRMLTTREEVFDDYTGDRFEQAFSARFVINERVALTGSSRVIYLMTLR
jgi:hypothetical protein